MYKAILSPDFTLTFDPTKAVDMDIELDILAPKLLPDGTPNTNRDLGKMVVTEA